MLPSQDINELKSDLSELESVLVKVSRSNVRTIITQAITTLRSKVDEVEKNAKDAKVECPKEEKAAKQLYTSKVTNYGWDDGNKFVKVYITLPNVEKLTQEQISCDFTEISFKFVANNHNGKNYMLEIPHLANKIIPSSSTCRVKSGNVIVSLKKEKDGNTWGNLTEAEKKEKEKKDAKFDNKKDMDTSDPSAGIMNLMKKMYDDGDDDMKRMIKKTWYESQQKQKSGELGDVPGF